MSDIVLSAGVRSNLLQLQQTSDLITQTQTRLATGKRVNSALDNAINFFTAQGLDNRANDLSGLLDSMSNAINTIQAANNGITGITKLVQSAQSLVSQANQTSDTATRATLATQFNALLTQIGQLAGDSGFNGVNLLGGDALTVNFNEDASSSTTVTGVDYTNANASPLSVNNSTNNWADSAAIAVSGTQLTAALTVLRSESQTLSANAGQNPARSAGLAGGLPPSVPSITINKVCLSGLNAIAQADLLINAGEAEIVVAGGMESMTNGPHLLPGARKGYSYGDRTIHPTERDGLFDSFSRSPWGPRRRSSGSGSTSPARSRTSSRPSRTSVRPTR